MHFRSQSKSLPTQVHHKTTIESVLEGNEAPSDPERIELLSRLRDLEDEFQQLYGQSYHSFSAEIEALDPPAGSQNAYEAITQHLSALSCIRRIPIEIWQRIFEFVVFDPTLEDCDPLRLVCRVSRYWNAAATTHQVLWSLLPPVSYFNTIGPITPMQHGAMNRRLRVFLERSGSMKISFRFYYSSSQEVWKVNKSKVIETLGILIEVCERWKVAIMEISTELLEVLNRATPLPNLTKLQLGLNVWGQEWGEYVRGPRSLTVDQFANAPSLRHVSLGTTTTVGAQGSTRNNTTFYFSLPWHQIEVYRSKTKRDTSYHTLLLDTRAHERLKEIDCDAVDIVPSTIRLPEPATLPRLTRLCLRFGAVIQGVDVLRHLAKMTVPSLKVLEVHGAYFLHKNPLYQTVTDLVQRSGCSGSLVRLRLDENVAPGDVGQFRKFLLGCPSLEYLDVRMLEDYELASLAHHLVLPKLKILTLRWPSELAREPELRTPILQPSTLLEVVQSREQGSLQEVRLIGNYTEDNIEWNAQLNLFDFSELPQFTGGSMVSAFQLQEAVEWQKELQEKFTGIIPDLGGGRYYSKGAPANMMLHWEMHKLMRKLEELDLAGSEGLGQILVRRGVLHQLYSITHTEPGVIPGDRMYYFRKRAKDLLEKWKPVILPGYQALRHRWCYVSLASARLRCIAPTAVQESGDSQNVEVSTWNDAVGSVDSTKPPAEASIKFAESGWF
ncbi:hypothetical protein H1R20_g1136, partial [Candolleomyces eurysporus]